MKLGVLKNIWNHPANKGGKLAAIARALRWEVRRRISRATTTEPMIGGLSVRCDRTFRGAHVAIVYRGLYDFHDMIFLRRYLRPGDKFLDVGANVGLYTMMMSRLVGPGGSIDAFEAVPSVANRLRENLALNSIGNVTVHQFAASNQPGVLKFKVSGDDLTSHIAYDSDSLDTGVIEVQAVTLDESVGQNTYAAGQLDAEGAEPMVLAGAASMLAQGNPPVLFIEVNGCLHGYGWTEERFAEWLADQGYDLAKYDAVSQILSPLQLPITDGSDNVLAICRARRAEVEARLQEGAQRYPGLANTAASQSWP